MCRLVGIDCGVLPKNFPTAYQVRIDTINVKKADWSGYGGTDLKNRPFVTINLAHAGGLVDVIATMAHEMLHIKQAVNNKEWPHHGNTFRADCAKFCRALGVTYYHLNGYDKPSVQTVKGQCRTKIRAIKKHHSENKK